MSRKSKKEKLAPGTFEREARALEAAKVAAYLAQLPDAELRNVLAEVLSRRCPYPEEMPSTRSHFFLAIVTQSDEAHPGAPTRWGHRRILGVAHVDREKYPENGSGPDWGFCQFGTCGCGTDVCSNYKNGICPVCGATVSMT